MGVASQTGAMTQFTQQEIETIRNGAMGAIALVSQAEPGFLATFKESMAASKALAGAPEEFIQVMKSGISLPPAAGNRAEMEDRLIENLRQAVGAASKDPATLDALKNYVSAATQQVAEAAKGVSPGESAMMERIHGVLQQDPAEAGVVAGEGLGSPEHAAAPQATAAEAQQSTPPTTQPGQPLQQDHPQA